MEFLKYPSIENSYRDKHIQWWVGQYPELLDEEYIIVEKVHGANFQILIGQDEVKFASRNRILESGMDFFDYENVMVGYSDLIDTLQGIVLDRDIELMRVYGELFGSNIQRGVNYGSDKRFKIFDIYINDELISQKETMELLKSYNLIDYFVPVICTVKGLEKAMQIDIEFDTMMYDQKDNICEGVVIKPYRNTYCNDEGSVFYLKQINDKFRQNQKKRRPKQKELNKQLMSVQNIYEEYLNDNRVQGIFSKHGEISQPNEIGRYIQLVLDDAKEDFLKDNSDVYEELNNEDKRKVFSITGKHIAPILQEYL